MEGRLSVQREGRTGGVVEVLGMSLGGENRGNDGGDIWCVRGICEKGLGWGKYWLCQRERRRG